MIITKHYEMGITGKFQGRKFATTLSFDTTNPADAAALKEVMPVTINELSAKLQSTVVTMVKKDIATLSATDPNFVIIEAAAQDELDKFVKYQEGVKKVESHRR